MVNDGPILDFPPLENFQKEGILSCLAFSCHTVTNFQRRFSAHWGHAVQFQFQFSLVLVFDREQSTCLFSNHWNRSFWVLLSMGLPKKLSTVSGLHHKCSRTPSLPDKSRKPSHIRAWKTQGNQLKTEIFSSEQAETYILTSYF